MPDTEVTSDYSGSLTPTSSSDESEEEDTGSRSKQHLCETSALLWTGTGTKKCPLIIFRPESLISRERKLKAIGEKYHLSYKMVKTESKLVRSLLSAYGFHEVHPNSADFNLMWTGAHLKPFSLRSLQEFQKVNHFPRSYEITRKDRLYKNIERMAHTKGAKHFDFVPRSYLMPSEYQEFCAAFVKEKGSWIVKPIASSRGRGIYLINNPNQVPLEDNIMVCKYISNPLLIDGFKFDVRVYVAVTSYDPLLIYMFEEGLTRFATVKYEKTNRHLKNQMMHLTNYSINKKSHDYVRCEDPDVEDYGNKWSMSAMLRYMKQEGINTTELMMKMEAVIIKSILAAELPIATACRMFVPHRENCVELYGFDILVDENLKPWILEGNLSPSLACDAPLDLKIKSHMVSDFFSLAGFSCVDPLTRKQSKKQLDVMRGPNKRPQSASTAPKDVARGSLSAEEAKVLKMAKEQYQRRGSFVRIFPTPETWEVYGSFLEYKSSLNHMLAQKLFPDIAFSSRPTSGAYSSAVARMRSVASSQMLEGRSRLASERSMQYERKLLSLESSKKRRLGFSEGRKKTKHKPTPIGYDNKSLAQGRLMNNENGEESDSGETCELEQSQKVKSSSSAAGDNSSRLQPEPWKSSSTSTAKTTKKGLSSRSDKSNPSVSNQKVDASVSCPSVKQSVSPTSSSQHVYMYKTDGLKEMPKHHKKGDSASGTTCETSSTNLVKQENKPLEKSASASDLPDEEKGQLGKPHPAPPAAPPAVMVPSSRRSLHQTSAKKSVNVLEVLKSGGNLGKVQARQAFSSYLSRVQHRLMAESEKHSKDTTDLVLKQEEQMDLVLRFLKRAASNLRQTFSVIIPSRRLSLCDRKRILAKQLGDFVHIYNKETESMEHKQHMSFHKDNISTGSLKGPESTIQDEDFRIFVSAASELALEEVLTAYTHKNKSASVFLGASRPKSANIRSPQSGRSFKENFTQDNYGANDMESRQLKSNMGSSANWFHKNKIAEHVLSPHSLTDEEALASGDVSSLKGIKTTSHSALHSANFHPQTSSMSSMQQAAYLYSAKLTPAKSNSSQRRPASAKVFTPSTGLLHTNSSGRPLSASNRPLGGNLHYQTATNHEALVDALQRLSEKQAARQYSAPGQLSGLTNHLSTLNLSNLDTVQRNHPQLGGIGATPHRAFPHKSSSLCDLASFDPSVQSMVDPGQHGKYSHMLSSASSVSKLPQESSFQPAQILTEESNEQLQRSRAKHQAFIAQTRNPSNPSRSRLKERVKSDNNGAPLNVLTRPPSIPKPPDRSRLPDRTVPFRKPFSSPRMTSPARREPEIPDKNFNYYASLKYDNNTGATKLSEDALRQTKPSTFTPQATDDKAAVSQLSNGSKPMWRP